MLLRRKVLNRIRPKEIDGVAINGSMWYLLAEKYVQAINEGAVPNIQSSWAYICRQKAKTAFEGAIEVFKTEMSDVSMPANQDDFEENLKDSTTIAFEFY